MRNGFPINIIALGSFVSGSDVDLYNSRSQGQTTVGKRYRKVKLQRNSLLKSVRFELRNENKQYPISEVNRICKRSLCHMSYLMIPLTLIGMALYFLPSIIALTRHKRQTLAIFLLNLFAGWTGIGWIGALIWAAIKEKTEENS